MAGKNLVGKNIKKTREEKGLSQEQLAERLNMTRQAVSNWERGKTEPDIETLQRLSEVLEVSVEELIYGEKAKTGMPRDLSIKIGSDGLTVGAALAMIISYVKWQSIGWALLHGLLNWIYVIYYIIKYGWS